MNMNNKQQSTLKQDATIKIKERRRVPSESLNIPEVDSRRFLTTFDLADFFDFGWTTSFSSSELD